MSRGDIFLHGANGLTPMPGWEKVDAASRRVYSMNTIGTLNEKPLHAALKDWCARPGDQFEVFVDGFVVDIVRGNLLIEIQTGKKGMQFYTPHQSTNSFSFRN